MNRMLRFVSALWAHTNAIMGIGMVYSPMVAAGMNDGMEKPPAANSMTYSSKTGQKAIVMCSQ